MRTRSGRIRVGRDQSLVSYQKSAKPPEPCEGALDGPSMCVTSQVSPGLAHRFCVIRSFRYDWQNIAIEKKFSERIAVVSAVGDKSFHMLCMRRMLKRLFNERHFSRACRIKVCA